MHRVGPAAGSVGAHMRVVVDALGLRDGRQVDGSGVGRSVQAEAATVSAMLDIFCVVLCVARDDITEATVVVERLRAGTVFSVPVKHHVEPSEVCAVHARRHQLAKPGGR